MSTEKKLEYGVVYDIPLKDIHVPWGWNSRSGNFKEGTVDESESGYAELKHSIEMQGQNQAVTIRPNIDPKIKQPFVLVIGFRRAAAISELGKKDPGRFDTIKSILLNLDPIEAREANLSENTARLDLKGPDLAFGLLDLKKLYADAKKPWTQIAIAHKLGKNQGYINMLDKIITAVKPEILKEWREGPISVPIQTMNKLAEETPDKQPAKWDSLKKAQVEKADGRSKKGKEEQLLGRASSIGDMLGKLVHGAYITVVSFDTLEPDFWSLVGITVPEELAELLPKMTEAAAKAFETASNPSITEAVKETKKSSKLVKAAQKSAN